MEYNLIIKVETKAQPKKLPRNLNDLFVLCNLLVYFSLHSFKFQQHSHKIIILYSFRVFLSLSLSLSLSILRLTIIR
ncbi:hypothetical protein P8452_34991 [Trifolium repens]|nr:hypothetical protein P8452_34991 [Trifolium repens]